MSAAPTSSPSLLTPADLVPGPGLEPGPDTQWTATEASVRFTAEGPFAPGWYHVRLGVTSGGRFTIHKRAELVFESDENSARPAARETFTWNRRFDEKFILRLTRPAQRLRLDLHRCEGEFTLEGCEVAPIPDRQTLLLAIREKFKLIRAYRCVGPVLWRGSRMLLTGRFRQFRAKLLKGLVDARQMRVGSGRTDEVDAAWWRRHTLTRDEAERVAKACDEMVNPPPLAVLLPVTPDRLDAARLAAHSVRRQIYPHWELIIAAIGPAGLTHHLENIVGHDPRVRVTRLSGLMGLATSVGKAIGLTTCDRVLVLPPGLELAEDALYQLARGSLDQPEAGAIRARVYDSDDGIPAQVTTENESVPLPRTLGLTRTENLARSIPRSLTPRNLAEWTESTITDPSAVDIDSVLAYPIEDRPLIDKARIGRKPDRKKSPLYLGAHLVGISGYDHLVYAFVKGLPSLGIDLRLHPKGGIRPDLIPPKLMPARKDWQPGAPELLVCPPWIVKKFKPGRNTAVYTMWECDRLDAATTATLNLSKLVIVPSQWSADCFRASGVTVPIEVAPLGYDPLVFSPGTTPPPAVCTFGTAGALIAGGMRKNTQRVIDLFRATFPDAEDVRLRVKITPTSPAVETYDDPRIDVIRAVLPHGELAEWYRSLTAYVNASAAEGFGLHLIEAMACARPLISPHYSGLTAFFDPEIGYPVDYKLVHVRNDIYEGNWADPDDASMAQQMRRVYADRAEAARLGERSATRAKNFTWKAAGQMLRGALQRHGYLA